MFTKLSQILLFLLHYVYFMQIKFTLKLFSMFIFLDDLGKHLNWQLSLHISIMTKYYCSILERGSKHLHLDKHLYSILERGSIPFGQVSLFHIGKRFHTIWPSIFIPYWKEVPYHLAKHLYSLPLLILGSVGQRSRSQWPEEWKPFPLNNLSTLWARAFKLHRVVALFE